jgi:hypothetical protein
VVNRLSYGFLLASIKANINKALSKIYTIIHEASLTIGCQKDAVQEAFELFATKIFNP